MPKVWRDGVQRDGTLAEFTEQLRWFSDFAEERYSIMSDTSAMLAESLADAANEIDRLARKCGEQ